MPPMKFTSALVTAASGSIGGMTASRNRGGSYLRGRVIPVNPNTERQGIARANMASAVHAWTNTLTDANRQAWISYAQATPTTDVLGNSLVLSGQQMFIKSALPRLVADLAIVEAGPITAGLATTPEPGTGSGAIEVTVASGITGEITVPGSGTSGVVNIYMSEPVPPSRTPAHARRAFAGRDQPPVADVFTLAMAAASLPYEPVAGLVTRITCLFLDVDGRVSAEAFRDIVIA